MKSNGRERGFMYHPSTSSSTRSTILVPIIRHRTAPLWTERLVSRGWELYTSKREAQLRIFLRRFQAEERPVRKNQLPWFDQHHPA